MLSIYLSIAIIGILMAVFGPRSFVLGLGSFLLATFWMLGKILKALFDVFDVIELIFHILSLLG